MYDVSLFVQMLDDWIDEEKDRKEARATPVLSGTWTLATVREQFVATLNGLEGLAERSGFGSAAFVDFAREAYRLMAHEVMQAMVKGTAA